MIQSTVIQGLLELIVTDMQSESTTHDPEVDAFLASTVRYIQFQKQKGDSIAERYASIQVQWDCYSTTLVCNCHCFTELHFRRYWIEENF